MIKSLSLALLALTSACGAIDHVTEKSKPATPVDESNAFVGMLQGGQAFKLDSGREVQTIGVLKDEHFAILTVCATCERGKDGAPVAELEYLGTYRVLDGELSTQKIFACKDVNVQPGEKASPRDYYFRVNGEPESFSLTEISTVRLTRSVDQLTFGSSWSAVVGQDVAPLTTKDIGCMDKKLTPMQQQQVMYQASFVAMMLN